VTYILYSYQIAIGYKFNLPFSVSNQHSGISSYVYKAMCLDAEHVNSLIVKLHSSISVLLVEDICFRC
jgi:hypothetical protein